MPSKQIYHKTCPHCKSKHETTNPRKFFCKEKCRVEFWLKKNPRVKIEVSEEQEKINRGEV